MANAGPNGQQVETASLQFKGGAAVVAPVSAFPNGLPANAIVVLPLPKPDEALLARLEEGPLVVTPEQMWPLLGFNGPAVQVQDDQGRPIAIGLEDLLGGLEKHWEEQPDDLNRARMLAQELLKHGRQPRAEQVLSKIVAKGGTGEDWLALGISQLAQDKLDKAEPTLKGAQNLLKTNPYPSLHLAKLYAQRGDTTVEREWLEKAIGVDVNCVDAWALLFQSERQRHGGGEDGAAKGIALLEQLASGKRTAAPWIAVQGFYANDAETRDRAMVYAQKAIDSNPDDALGYLCLSALYGQKGDLEAVVRLLQPLEGRMTRDVRLANNYFEALFQSRQFDKVTKLLNALTGSANRDVKQFAMERARAVGQYLQQQQAQLAQVAQRS